MSVAEVGTTSTFSPGGVGGTTRTLSSYSLNASANCLVVRVHFQDDSPTNDTTITSVTWSGSGSPVALTSVGALVHSNPGHGTQIFRLVNPTTGSGNVVVTFSATVTFGGLSATGLSGVDTADPTSSFQSGSGDSAASPASIDPVTSETGDLVINAWTRDTTATATAQNQTEQYREIDAEPFLVIAGGKADGAASVDPGWTYSGNASWSMASINFNATSTPPASGAIIFNRMIG